MICENCGKENKDTARFCSECGKALIDKPIELDLQEIKIPAVSRKPKIIKVNAAKAQNESEEKESPKTDVNSLFLPKEEIQDSELLPESEPDEEENEIVKEFKIFDNEPDSEIKKEMNASDFAPDFDSIEDVKPQSPEADTHKPANEEKPMSIGGWIGTFIITAIPVLNIIMLLVWAISKKTNKSKKSYAAAVLIFSVILAVLGSVSIFLLIKFANFNPSQIFNNKF